MTFVQAAFVLVTFVHIKNISAVTDTIWTKLLRQGQGKVKAMSRQSQGKVEARLVKGQDKVMAMTKPVQDKVRASSWQGQGEDKAR